MKSLNLEKDWDSFVKGKICINCYTEELAVEFLNFCKGKGMKWRNGDDLNKDSEWYQYEKETCYFCDDQYISFGEFTECRRFLY